MSYRLFQWQRGLSLESMKRKCSRFCTAFGRWLTQVHDCLEDIMAKHRGSR